jgi:hypothetical protein
VRVLRAFAVAILSFGLLAAVIASSPASVEAVGGSGDDSAGGADGNKFWASVSKAGIQHGLGPAQGGVDTSGCSWEANGSTFLDPKIFEEVRIIDGLPYKAMLRLCPGTPAVLVMIPQISPQQLGTAAADFVVGRILKPTMNAAPPLTKGVVKVGMWFWTDPNQYAPLSVSVWVPTANGSMTATATATPTVLMFDSGEPDGERVRCAGPGQAWIPEYGDELPSNCMYTYQHSSEIDPNDVFTARLSTVWTMAWKASNGAGGDLGQYTASTTHQVTVNEIQALITQ